MTLTPFLLVAFLCVGLGNAVSGPHLETIKQWNLFNFNFPWEWPVSDKDLFDPEKIVATGFEIGNNRIFVATPRLFSGVPATLTAIRRDTVGDSPVLEAYPDWSHHTSGLKQYNCSDIGLISVYRLKIDSCNRLWAVDAGVSRSLEDFEVTCPPKILVYDLNTDRVVRRIDFPAEVVRNDSLFTNIVIDETASRPENQCDDVMVYITDTVAPAIVVYDSGRDLTWRLSHPSMFPDPDFAESRIGDYRFELMDGVVGFSFDPENRVVYYQPLATDRLFAVSTEALKQGPLPVGQELPVRLIGKKSSQGIGLGASPVGGLVYFSPFTETAIAEYNPKTTEQKVLAYDPEGLQFVADFKTTDKEPGSLFAISSRFHRYFLKNIDPKDINIRIIRIANVVPSSPSPFKFGPIPQYHENNVGSFATPHVFPQVLGQQSPKPGFSFFNINSHHPAPTTPSFAYNPTLRIPTHYQHPVVKSTPYPSHYMLPPVATSPALPSRRPYKTVSNSHPYAFEHFGIPNKSVYNPFFNLNAGEIPIQYHPHNTRNYYRPFAGNSNFVKRSLLSNSTAF